MQFEIFDLGLIDFKKASDFQRQRFLALKSQGASQSLILCRHLPVITLGRRANRNNILASAEELSWKGIEVCEAERGGDVTYHGPGQLTVYPVFNLINFRKDIRFFLRYLEGLAIELLFNFGIKAERIPGSTGVWVDNKKIASIGIAIKNWISFYGLSINIKQNDLANFALIRPCGMDIEMTSLETVSGKHTDISAVKERLFNAFKEDLYGQSCLAAVR